MAERSIGAEVLQGLREVKQCRAGTRTLRTTRVEAKPLPGLTPELIKRIRQEIDVSRAAFAGLLRVPVRTVESWEQGRSSPPPAAAALILNGISRQWAEISRRKANEDLLLGGAGKRPHPRTDRPTGS